VRSQAVMRLLAGLVGRPEWGRAMLAEAEQISPPGARRRFVRGCLRALALSVPALAGGVVMAGLLGVAVVIASLVRYPGLVTGVGVWLAVGSCVAVIAGYAVGATSLTTRLVPSRPTTPVLVTGAAIAASWLAVGLSASAAPPRGVPMGLLGASVAAALLLGWRATRRSSLVTGVQTVSLAALVAGLGLFLLWAGETVIFAGRPYDAGLLRDFRASAAPDLATYAVNDSLGTGMMLLLLVPALSLVAGAVGAVAAAGWSRPRPV
jgi:hypothetical protein